VAASFEFFHTPRGMGRSPPGRISPHPAFGHLLPAWACSQCRPIPSLSPAANEIWLKPAPDAGERAREWGPCRTLARATPCIQQKIWVKIRLPAMLLFPRPSRERVQEGENDDSVKRKRNFRLIARSELEPIPAKAINPSSIRLKSLRLRQGKNKKGTATRKVFSFRPDLREKSGHGRSPTGRHSDVLLATYRVAYGGPSMA
jgi:hypothetical protein